MVTKALKDRKASWYVYLLFKHSAKVFCFKIGNARGQQRLLDVEQEWLRVFIEPFNDYIFCAFPGSNGTKRN